MPCHVLVRVEDEDSVHAALLTLAYKIRPRLKPGFGRRVLGIWVKNASGTELFRDPSDTEHEPEPKDIAKDEVHEDAKAPALATDGEDTRGDHLQAGLAQALLLLQRLPGR